MTDKLQRPEDFEFALDFLGDPEASELRAYIEQLEARAALAQPEPEVVWPTYSEALALRDELDANGYGTVDLVAFARAVLARWGRPAPASAGEVGELARSLHHASDALRSYALHGAAEACTRAADLLSIAYATGPEVWEPIAQLPQQRHPAPVPVAERLPGPEDCDAEHYCWRWNTIGGLWARQPLARSWYEFESHWLPATALPLPQGEVQP